MSLPGFDFYVLQPYCACPGAECLASVVMECHFLIFH